MAQRRDSFQAVRRRFARFRSVVVGWLSALIGFGVVGSLSFGAEPADLSTNSSPSLFSFFSQRMEAPAGLFSSGSDVFLSGNRLPTKRWSGWPTESTGAATSIYRGNLSDLKIAPFQLRCVGTLYGEWGSLDDDGDGANAGFKTGVFGGSLGADRLFGNNVLLGVHAHGASVDIKPNDPDYDGSVTSVSGLARMSLFENLWYWDFAIGVGQNRYENVCPSTGGTRSRNQTATQWNYASELGMKFRSGFTKIEPFIGVRWLWLDGDIPVFSEKTTVFDQSDNKADSVRTFLGSRFSWEYATYTATFKPSLWGMWVHEFADEDLFTTNDSLELPVAWRFGNSSMPRDRMILGVGTAAALRDMVDLWIHYDTNIAGRYTSYTLSTGIHVKY